MRYRLAVIWLTTTANLACSGGALDGERAAGLIGDLDQFKREAHFRIQTGVPLQSAFKCLAQEEVSRVPVNRFAVDRGWVRFEPRAAVLGFGTKTSCPAMVLTPSGVAASAGWTRGRTTTPGSDGASWGVPIGRRELLAVTKLTAAPDDSMQVEFDWRWTPNETGTALRQSVTKAGALFDQIRKGRASCRRLDRGWRCQLGMWTTPADALGELP
jgi:hypothetical protein